MTALVPGSDEWLAAVSEPILDPERPIVDPHHHLWDWPTSTYLLENLWADTGSGHNVTKTVFVECRSSYRDDGPAHLKPIGETEFVEAIASESREGDGAEIAGIVAHADLRRPELDEVLDAHEEASKGLFRGIRHAGARDPDPEALSIPGRAPEGLYASDEFRKGVARLGERGYLLELTDTAKEFLIKKGSNLDYGARPLRRAIENFVEDPLAEHLLQGEFSGDDKIVVDAVVEDGKTRRLSFVSEKMPETEEPVPAVVGGEEESPTEKDK